MPNSNESPKNNPAENGIKEIKDALHVLKASIEGKKNEEISTATNELAKAYIKALDSNGNLPKEKIDALKKVITTEDIAMLYRELSDEINSPEAKLKGKLSDLAKEITGAAPLEKPLTPEEKIYKNIEKMAKNTLDKMSPEMTENLKSWGLTASKIISGILTISSQWLAMSKLPGMSSFAMNLRYLQIKKDVENNNDKKREPEEKTALLKTLEKNETKDRFARAYTTWVKGGGIADQPHLKEALEEEKKVEEKKKEELASK